MLLPPMRSAPVVAVTLPAMVRGTGQRAVDVQPQRRAVIRRGEMRPRVERELRSAGRSGVAAADPDVGRGARRVVVGVERVSQSAGESP